MVGADEIDDIRRLGRSGASAASIARDTGVSEPTVRKRLREADFSERPPEVGSVPGLSLLAPYTGLIDSLLAEDRRCRRRQRRTTKRVCGGLVGERDFEGSYSTVRRYVKRRRRDKLATEHDAREAQGHPLLDRAPGECQVDFGQADFRVRGVITRGHFLMGALPYPDVGLSRVFWVETDECSAGGSGTCSGSRAACPCAPCPATSPRSAAGSAPRSGLGAVPPLRGAPRAGLQLHRPLLRQRAGVRGEPGGRDQEEPLRAGALVLQREGLQREAPGGVPGGRRGERAATGRENPSQGS